MHGEDGRIRADAQCKGEDYGKSKAGIAAKAVDRDPKASLDAVQPRQRHRVATFIPGKFQGSEFLPRAAFRIAVTKTIPNVVANPALEMETELLVHPDLPLASFPPGEESHAPAPILQS